MGHIITFRTQSDRIDQRLDHMVRGSLVYEITMDDMNKKINKMDERT